jgi:hypothetical protein
MMTIAAMAIAHIHRRRGQADRARRGDAHRSRERLGWGGANRGRGAQRCKDRGSQTLTHLFDLAWPLAALNP